MPRSSLLLAFSGSIVAAHAFAATPGFQQDFSAGLGGFGGGSTITHVTSGGVGGALDPYLSVSNAIAGQLGTYSADVNLVGNLPADGVTGYTFWLRDVGANDNHEIHVGVGQAGVNFWLHIPGFTPPDGVWQQFSVDFSNPSQWVRIIGTGTFQAARANSNRLLFRHDLAPFVMLPDNAAGDFGLDRVQVLPAPPPMVPALSATGLAVLGLALVAIAGFALYRRAAAAPPALR
jgi:hypothetical protein